MRMRAAWLGIVVAAACGEVLPAEGPPPGADAGIDAAVADDSSTGGDGPAPTCENVDTMTSAQHCGRCDHDCLGGACAAGECQPVVLATATRDIPWLVLDTTRVIWGTGVPEIGAPGEIFACPKVEGCPVTGAKALACLSEGRQKGGVSPPEGFADGSRRRLGERRR